MTTPRLVIFFLLLLSPALKAEDFPKKANTLVTDLTGTFDASQINELESRLVAFDDSTSTEIAVVVIKSTDNYEIADYSVQLFNQWKIGSKKNNNGILLLVALGDRKVWITTGYGVEGVLPDALCRRIVETDILPEFRKGNFYAGVFAGTTSIMKIVSGEYTAEQYMKKEDKPIFFPFLMFLFIIFIVIISRIGRVRRYANRNNLAFWAAWALLNAASSRSRGSWGGFSGGGGFGGGGGGGGFGGFGGGMSGGGGAGGSW